MVSSHDNLFTEVEDKTSNICSVAVLDPRLVVIGACIGLVLAALIRPKRTARTADEIEDDVRHAMNQNAAIHLEKTHSTSLRRHIAISLSVTKQFVDLSRLSDILNTMGASLTGLSQTDYPNARTLSISINSAGGTVAPSPRAAKLRWLLCAIVVFGCSLATSVAYCVIHSL
tara:strand:- start:1769 stop:2284 length:516 start_codon:yes stop_codon:yes gene_type:complete